MGKLYWRDVGFAMGSFLAITYVFCIASELPRSPIVVATAMSPVSEVSNAPRPRCARYL